MKKTLLCKVMGLALGASLLLTSLAGCQAPGGSPGEQTDGEKTGDHEAITILTGGQKYQAFSELLKEKYPEVNLEFISIAGGDTSGYMKKSLEQGDVPDIYTVTYVPDGELQKTHLLDLSSYSVVNEYASTTVDGLSVDGGVYLLPSRYALLGIVYNKTLMEEHDWEVPESFEDLEELAPKIQEAGYEVANMKSYLTGTTFGTFFALGNTNFFNTPEGAQWKTDFLNGDAKAVGTLEGVADYFQKWIDAGFINTYYYDHPDESTDADFDQRKYVFQLYSNRMTGENGTDEYGFLPFLSEDGKENMLVRLVSRYYGLDKELGEEGNEQKLEDALKVLNLMASQEGQEALADGSNAFIPSTSINELPEGSPYRSVLELINNGNMIDMVFAGWENHIVPLIEEYGNPWIRGEITSEEFLTGMDTLNAELQGGNEMDKIGVAQDDISIADTAKLCAIAEGKAANADAALIPLPGFHGFSEGENLENKKGVHTGIYKGSIMSSAIAIFASGSDEILTVKLTGSEIKALADAGFRVEGDNEPYEYCLATKGGMELQDDETYTLAIGNEELSNADVLEKAKNTEIDPKQAMIDYITEIGTVSETSINWD